MVLDRSSAQLVRIGAGARLPRPEQLFAAEGEAFGEAAEDLLPRRVDHLLALVEHRREVALRFGDRLVADLDGDARDVELERVEGLRARREPHLVHAAERLAQLADAARRRQRIDEDEQVDIGVAVGVASRARAGQQPGPQRAERLRSRHHALGERAHLLCGGVHPGGIVDSSS